MKNFVTNTLGFDWSVFQQSKIDLTRKVLFIFLANLLIHFGVAFNLAANFGVGPQTAFADGLHHFFNIKMGLAVSIINYTIYAIVLIFGRRYVNIGTLLFILPCGFFTDLGIAFYDYLNIPDLLSCKIISVIIGHVFSYIGTAIFLAMNIGLSTKAALVKILCDATSKQFRTIKILLDIPMLAIGFLLGGEIGIATVISAFVGGPATQFFYKLIKKSTCGLFRCSARIKEN